MKLCIYKDFYLLHLKERCWNVYISFTKENIKILIHHCDLIREKYFYIHNTS